MYSNMTNLWLAILFRYLAIFSSAILFTAASSLTLEQIPDFRGTMMSMHIVAWNLGASLGTGIGGIILLNYNYNVLGIVLGLMSLMSALIFFIWAIDPTNNSK